MRQLSQYDKELLIDSIQNGKEIPEEYKYALFPTKQKEYELVYAGKMRKEDILADNEEAKAVPLQVEKVFNGKKHPLNSKDWQNILVFGDNLQFLKTCYRNQDPLIKDKVKGKVDLIYIDPPFGTGEQYDASKGQNAYSAKRRGADFVEFLRRRLYLLWEMLAETGSIVVRVDYHFGHYVKVVLDEVFGKGNFRNEIIVNRTRTLKGEYKQFATATDSLFLYARNKELMVFNGFRKLKPENEWKWVEMHLPGIRKDESLLYKKVFGKTVKAPKGRRWALSQAAFDDAIGRGLVRMNQKTGLPQFLTKYETIGSNWTDISGYSKYYDYPTENSEELLERVMLFGTKDPQQAINDGEGIPLIMDVFAGSGTTLAVAEKLGRRWIGCDIGKLSIYTIQKRLLMIADSKALGEEEGKYRKEAKAFCTVTAGLYDLGKIFNQVKDKYIDFVSQLFEVERLEHKRIGGIEIDGKRGEFYVKIFPYWEFKDANVDEQYIEDLHKNIGKKIDERFYIIAPANSVDFISDYHPMGDVRYYFLKVPYQIIKELHKVQFKKLRQPQSKSNVNDLEDAIGFHFIRQPEVKSKVEERKDKVALRIAKFYSQYSEEESHEELDNFESLAMVLVDLKYNSETFLMTDYFFADDLISGAKKKNTEEEFEEDVEEIVDEEKIRNTLKGQKEIKLEFAKKDCGKEIVVVYVDIYGNEFREILKVR